MSERRAEQRHDPVAHDLVHRALEAMHAVGDNLEKILDDPEPLFGIEPFGEFHRAFDIREQHRDVLALAFQRESGLADLVGEVLGWRRRARTPNEVASSLSDLSPRASFY